MEGDPFLGCFKRNFVLTANFKEEVKKLQETTEFLAKRWDVRQPGLLRNEGEIQKGKNLNPVYKSYQCI